MRDGNRYLGRGDQKSELRVWRLGAVAILNRKVRKGLTEKRSSRGEEVGNEAVWDETCQAEGNSRITA